MSCKICSNKDLTTFIEALKEQRLTYREILTSLEKIGIHISIGTLSNHFFHSTLSRISIPKLEGSDRYLTEDMRNRLDEPILQIMENNFSAEELIMFRDSLKRNKPSTPKIETIESYLHYISLSLNDSSIPTEKKQSTLEKYETKLEELGYREMKNNIIIG